MSPHHTDRARIFLTASNPRLASSDRNARARTRTVCLLSSVILDRRPHDFRGCWSRGGARTIVRSKVELRPVQPIPRPGKHARFLEKHYSIDTLRSERGFRGSPGLPNRGGEDDTGLATRKLCSQLRGSVRRDELGLSIGKTDSLGRRHA
jgi:hypothetical protein